MAASQTVTPLGIDLSKLFEASSIRQIASGQPTPLLIQLARQLATENGSQSLREIMRLAHDSLGRVRRCEYFYKNLLINKIVFGIHSPKTTSVFSEFRISDSRADLLFVNQRAKIYEIKTDLDDLKKGKKQAYAYLSCFKDVTFVIADGHIDAADRQLPPEVGITVVNERGRLVVIRPSTPTAKYLEKESIFNCLLKHEYRSLVGTRQGGDDLGYVEALALLDSMEPIDLQAYLVICLRAREQRKVRALGWPSIPPSLLAAAYSYQMSAAEWRSVLSVLDTPLAEVL